jgi:CubicO group peptidase (beta-lactamase class C family)
MSRPAKFLLLAASAALLALGGFQAQRLAGVASAFTAKYLCSEAFVGGRDADAVAQTDLPAFRSGILGLVDWRVDAGRHTVSAHLLGIGRRQAIYREGLGCTLVIDQAPVNVPLAESASTAAPADPLPVAPTPSALTKVIDDAFAEPDPEHPRRTRAVVVVQHGRMLAERYAPGYSVQSRFNGWSMSKSVVNALVGILVAHGQLALDAPAPVREWAGSKDPRRAITVDQMLRMSSGLEFAEDYANPLADVVWLLYGTGDSAAFAAAKPLVAAPGTSFNYGSGTTAVISRILAEDGARHGEGSYPQFAQRELFAPLGMSTALIEPDAAGTPIGSSYVWASARDWARFGLLYLKDGVWQGRRILPTGWVRYTLTPAPADKTGEYGAHFWIKVPAPFHAEPARPHLLPADAYHAVGYGGQFVTVVPSRDRVGVRLGLALDRGAWNHEAFIHELTAALAASNTP